MPIFTCGTSLMTASVRACPAGAIIRGFPQRVGDERLADEKVLVLDFGSQYAQLIARRVRAAAGVLRDRPARYHGRADPRVGAQGADPLRRAGQRVRSRARRSAIREIFRLGVPVLGICYGMQLACEALGGRVEGAPAREYGRAHCRIGQRRRTVRRRAGRDSQVWMSHGDQVSQVSDDFLPLAATATCPIAAVKHRRLPIYGLQFHPEVTHTPLGAEDPGQLPQGGLRLLGHVEAGRFRPRDDRRHPPPRGRRPGDLRAFRRGRFLGRGRPAGRGHRPAALVHPGRQRPAAEGRGRVGDPRVHQPFQDRPARGPGRRPFPRRRWRASTDPQEKRAADRPRLHRVLCRRGRARSKGPSSSPRGRSIPT